MTENTKKWLTVAGCLVVCAILVAVIASSFSKDKVTDDLLPPSSSQQGDVVVDPDSSTPPPAESGDDQKPGDNVTILDADLKLETALILPAQSRPFSRTRSNRNIQRMN